MAVAGGVSVPGAVSADGGVSVAGAVSADGGVNVAGGVNVDGTVSADGAVRSAAKLAIVVIDAPLVPAGEVVSIAPPSVAWVPRHHDLRAGATGDDDEWATIGWGIAARATGEGPDRFASVCASAARLWSRLDPIGAAALPFAPRLFGGFAFDPAGAPDAPGPEGCRERDRSGRGTPQETLRDAWSTFGDAAFFLPEVIYSYSTKRAVLAAFVPEPGVTAARRRLESLRDALETLAGASAASTGAVPVRSGVLVFGGSQAAVPTRPAFPEAAPPSVAPRGENSIPFGPTGTLDPGSTGTLGAGPTGTLAAGATGMLGAGSTGTLGAGPTGTLAGDATVSLDPSERAYVDIVARAVRAIEAGEMAKVVLCRTRRIAVDEGAATRAFAFLDERHTTAARFLVALGDRRFVGASPERLVFVHGRRIVTEALAGSLPRRPGEAEGDARADLLASEKDRAEHAFVVAAIRESLAPICEALSAPDEPVVRTLPNVHHLATPIAGLLERHAHALDVAARLHPTPALCGSPKSAARAFLIAHEAEPRGWYGGAVGWFDREGDGAFHVAIRSALVTPREAFVYAGAGVVRASDPESELVETIAKERAMREALTANPRSPRDLHRSPEAA